MVRNVVVVEVPPTIMSMTIVAHGRDPDREPSLSLVTKHIVQVPPKIMSMAIRGLVRYVVTC